MPPWKVRPLPADAEPNLIERERWIARLAFYRDIVAKYHQSRLE